MRLSAAMILVAATAASANDGLAPIAPGAKAAGRGGASVAVADDALSAHANPALLSEIPGIRADLGVMILNERRAVRKGSGADAVVDRNTATLPLPSFGLSWDPCEGPGLDEDGAEGASRPSDIRIGFGLFQPILAVPSPTVTVAWRPHPSLAIGGSLQMLLSYLTIDSTGSVGSNNTEYTPGGIVRTFRRPDGTPVDPPEPVFVEPGVAATWAEVYEVVEDASASGTAPRAGTALELQGIFGVGLAAQAGLLWSPLDALSIGLSARSPGVVFAPRGEAEIDFTDAILAAKDTPGLEPILDSALETYLPDGGANGFQSTYDIEADRIILPPEIAVGVAIRPLDRLLLACDVKWIGWSHATQVVEIEGTNGSNRDFNEINGGDSLVYRYRLDWKDQLVLGIGASVSVTRWLTLRLGYRHGNDPVPAERVTAHGFTITDHVTGGLSVYLGDWDLDLAYVYGVQTDGEVPTRNATFEVDQHIIWLGVGVRF